MLNGNNEFGEISESCKEPKTVRPFLRKVIHCFDVTVACPCRLLFSAISANVSLVVPVIRQKRTLMSCFSYLFSSILLFVYDVKFTLTSDVIVFSFVDMITQ